MNARWGRKWKGALPLIFCLVQGHSLVDPSRGSCAATPRPQRRKGAENEVARRVGALETALRPSARG
eukprot:4422976-Pyramimonas_sp.AAC.1